MFLRPLGLSLVGMLGVISKPESVPFSTSLRTGGGAGLAERGRQRISHSLAPDTFAISNVCLNSFI